MTQKKTIIERGKPRLTNKRIQKLINRLSLIYDFVDATRPYDSSATKADKIGYLGANIVSASLSLDGYPCAGTGWRFNAYAFCCWKGAERKSSLTPTNVICMCVCLLANMRRVNVECSFVLTIVVHKDTKGRTFCPINLSSVRQPRALLATLRPLSFERPRYFRPLNVYWHVLLTHYKSFLVILLCGCRMLGPSQ